MEYLRRRRTAGAVSRDLETVAALSDEAATVGALSDRLDDAVLVELLSPGTQVGDTIYVPRDHYDVVLDDLRDAVDRIETLDRVPIGLIDVSRSLLYRRGDARVDVDDLDSATAARERARDARRREMKLLTGTVSWSIFLGTAGVLAGGILDAPALLGVGIALLVVMIPVAIAVWQYFRGVKDHLLEVRDRHEAGRLEREVDASTVQVLGPGERPPSPG